jgi:peptidoglycan/xylan/chitin deacetylase (PgdA/CDA1 family)
VTIDETRSTEVVGISFHAIGVSSVPLTTEDRAYAITRDVFLAVLDEIAERSDVEVSFDDGFASDVEIALPALTERGMSAAFFPIADRLGRPGYVDSAGLRALSSAGMIVGTHGMRHRSWRGLDNDLRHEELVAARSAIAEAAGVDVTAAACPFGSYDRRVLRALRECGYQRVFTSDRRRAQAGAWLQPRYAVRRRDNIQTIRESILEPRPLYERARRAASARVKAWR